MDYPPRLNSRLGVQVSSRLDDRLGMEMEPPLDYEPVAVITTTVGRGPQLADGLAAAGVDVGRANRVADELDRLEVERRDNQAGDVLRGRGHDPMP